ncbi:MAG: biotin synthase BioB [Nitrospinae bacterium]|nr:biotin synthase BioB [Nitrospinota bacterium]
MSVVFDKIKRLEQRVISGNDITHEEALWLTGIKGMDLYDLIASANRIRDRYKGTRISLCAIINAKSGRCGEDCAFCAQSAHHKTGIEVYPLLDSNRILEGAQQALASGAHKFGIVISGKGIGSPGELEGICLSIRRLREETNIHRCASLGIIDNESAHRLKEAGLQEYHHNLETARSFFPNICTTHEYDEDIETIRIAKGLGLRVCCGGIFGMGESSEQRIELAFTLKGLDVDSVPLNFLHPIPGTRLEGAIPLRPMEILKIIAIYRFILPTKDIKVAGGREFNLRDLQSMIFAAGANSTMVGNYLTTKGRDFREDLQMIEDLELEIENGLHQ